MLGKKDYWLESYAHALEERLNKEEKRAERVKQQREEDRVFDLTVKRRQRIYGTKDYRPRLSEPQRQEAFKASMTLHSNRKFIVREDFADMVSSDDDADADADEEGEEGGGRERERSESVATVSSLGSLERREVEGIKGQGEGEGEAIAPHDMHEGQGGDASVSVITIDEPAETSMDAVSRPTTAPFPK